MKRGFLTLCVLLVLMSSCRENPRELILEGLVAENGDYLPMEGLTWGASADEVEKHLGISIGKPLDRGDPIEPRTRGILTIYRGDGPSYNGKASRFEYEFRDGGLESVMYRFPTDETDELFDSMFGRLKELYGEPHDHAEMNYIYTGDAYSWRQIRGDYGTGILIQKEKRISDGEESVSFMTAAAPILQ